MEPFIANFGLKNTRGRKRVCARSEILMDGFKSRIKSAKIM